MSVQRDSRIDSLGNDERSVLILKEILRDFQNNFVAINSELFEVQTTIAPRPTGEVGEAPAPINFRGQILPLSIFLSWEPATPTLQTYEIRRGSALIWDTADFVTRTPSLTVNLAPLPEGPYFFLIKTLDNAGNYSADFASVLLIVLAPDTPVVSAQVIDNNVLLNWSVPQTSFQIDRFRIYRNGNLFGSSRATFTPIFETVAGTYTYGVEAIDIAGNVGSVGTVTTIVNAPPDYQLQDRRISNLNGIMDNVVRLPIIPSLLACIVDDETWEQHFATRSWNTIQDQINAGYPIYAQPTQVTGWYEEVIDYLTVIQNTIVTINYQLVEIVPTVSVIMKLAYSSDNVNFSPFVVGNSQFIPQFRYLKMRLEFTGSSNKALAEFSLIQITLDVKREVDAGEVIAVKTDANGTRVRFNKVFKDIDSITATADSIEPIYIIYDFLDVPNPVEFFVYALDSTGNRVTYLVSWKARGIV